MAKEEQVYHLLPPVGFRYPSPVMMILSRRSSLMELPKQLQKYCAQDVMVW